MQLLQAQPLPKAQELDSPVNGDRLSLSWRFCSCLVGVVSVGGGTGPPPGALHSSARCHVDASVRETYTCCPCDSFQRVVAVGQLGVVGLVPGLWHPMPWL